MLANGLPERKCVVQPFGVDTSIFKSRDEVSSQARFICVGTICVRKGHQYLFRAFEKVQRQISDAELICVGGVSYDFRHERKKWDGTFVHYPSLSHTDLSQLLRQCSAFVLASVEEGFARVLTEAMAAGLPIIATYESGATTIVRDGIEGSIIPARDPEHLAEAMLRVVRDKDLNRQMGQAAHARGAAKNDWQYYGDRLLECYSKRLRDLPSS